MNAYGISRPREVTIEGRLEKAVKRVKAKQLTRAHNELSSPPLAPGDQATLTALSDPARRPTRRAEAISANVLNCQPHTPLRLNRKMFVAALRTSPKGSSGAFSGTRYEFLTLSLDDEAMLNNLI